MRRILSRLALVALLLFAGRAAAAATAWPDGRAVESEMAPDGKGGFVATPGPFDRPGASAGAIDFVLNFADGSWGRDRRSPLRK